MAIMGKILAKKGIVRLQKGLRDVNAAYTIGMRRT